MSKPIAKLKICLAGSHHCPVSSATGRVGELARYIAPEIVAAPLVPLCETAI